MTVAGAHYRLATAQPRRRRARDRHWLRAAVAIAALPVAYVMALIALVVNSLLISSAAAIAAAALLVGAPAAGVLVRLAFRRSRWATQSARLGVAGALVWAAVFWAVALRAPSVTPPARPVPGQHTWQLATGSHIAYLHFAAPEPRKGAPIVFLHGGPAVSELPDVAPIFRRLAATGHDVYLYDQLGAGRSARLPDPRGYTLQRAIADLEAIRVRLRVPKLILVGHSWGATLAANYLARYPERVERVVLSSPGSPNSRRSGVDGSPTSRLAFGQKLALYAHTLAPRSLAGYLLTLTNPVAAHAFASDAEMDRRFGAIFARSRPGLLCDPHLAERIGSDGVGHYAFQLTARDSRPYDPRPALRRLRTPALILRGSCDYLPPRMAREYHQLLTHSTLVAIPGAGHEAYLERPTAYLELIARFVGAPSAASPTAT
jgi:proline iminopeptidase